MDGSVSWRTAAASACGTSHADAGTPCQDRFAVFEIQGGNGESYLVAVVADGAGSAKYADKGAEIVCRVVGDYVREALDGPVPLISPDDVQAWVHAARARIIEAANEESVAPREFACTLVAAVVGESEALFFQIGDGAIVARALNQDIEIVFWPDEGEYVNATYFVTDNDFLKHLRIKESCFSVEELALFSDGMQRLALSYARHAPHAPFFNMLFPVLKRQENGRCETLDAELAAFLDSSAVNDRTDDDKTLIIAARISVKSEVE